MKSSNFALKITRILLVFAMMATLAGCSQATNVTYQLKDDSDEFKITRRITVVNLRTDTILYEIEGRISYTVETDGDLSIVAQVGKDKYKRDSIGIGQAGNGITYINEQIEPNEADPYHYHVKIYARLPKVDIVE